MFHQKKSFLQSVAVKPHSMEKVLSLDMLRVRLSSSMGAFLDSLTEDWEF
jgi:hypothetical protein